MAQRAGWQVRCGLTAAGGDGQACDAPVEALHTEPGVPSALTAALKQLCTHCWA